MGIPSCPATFLFSSELSVFTFHPTRPPPSPSRIFANQILQDLLAHSQLSSAEIPSYFYRLLFSFLSKNLENDLLNFFTNTIYNPFLLLFFLIYYLSRLCFIPYISQFLLPLLLLFFFASSSPLIPSCSFLLPDISFY